jgi:hypothetical protein
MSLVTESPFFSKAYGAFSAPQLTYIGNAVASHRCRAILDPMGGQASPLAGLVLSGADLHVSDINPAALLLATLRDPRLALDRTRLAKLARRVISGIRDHMHPKSAEQYSPGWLPQSIHLELAEYARSCDLSASALWGHSTPDALEARFLGALPVLAARSIATFTLSDNITWLRPGGLVREAHVRGPLLQALQQWLSWCDREWAVDRPRASEHQHYGSLAVYKGDACDPNTFPADLVVDAIVTSPPYANRLDYGRMWAPELAVSQVYCGDGPDEVSARQLGSTVVKGRSLPTEMIRRLPTSVRAALTAIRDDPQPYSASYYYPFFGLYALMLRRLMLSVACRLRPGGVLIIMVRDTVRRDILFPTAALVKHVAQKELGYRLIDRSQRIIKRHVGYRRKSGPIGMMGLAQQEWWLTFKRPIN